MTKHSAGDIYRVPVPGEVESEEQLRVPCDICNRKFLQDRLSAHREICTKTHFRDREREQGRQKLKEKKQKEEKKRSPREKIGDANVDKRDVFHNRAAEEYSCGGGTKQLQYLCEHCNRTFIASSFERHYTQCQERQKHGMRHKWNAASPELEKAEKLKRRIGYKPPTPMRKNLESSLAEEKLAISRKVRKALGGKVKEDSGGDGKKPRHRPRQQPATSNDEYPEHEFPQANRQRRRSIAEKITQSAQPPNIDKFDEPEEVAKKRITFRLNDSENPSERHSRKTKTADARKPQFHTDSTSDFEENERKALSGQRSTPRQTNTNLDFTLRNFQGWIASWDSNLSRCHWCNANYPPPSTSLQQQHILYCVRCGTKKIDLY